MSHINPIPMLRVGSYKWMCMLLSSISLTNLVDASGPTPIFINQVPAYSALSDCAEGALSQIVRNMVYGCGDGSVTTSFDCFCISSSSHFAHEIDTRVANACLDESENGQNASAVEVFGKYCQLSTLKSSLSTCQYDQQEIVKSSSPEAARLPKELPISTVSPISPVSMPTSSLPFASPAPGPATPSMTPPPSPPRTTASNDTQRHFEKEAPMVAIAVGVVVPCVTLCLGILAFVLYRRRRQGEGAQEDRDFPELSTEGQIVELAGHKEQQVMQTYASTVPFVELGGGEMKAELASSTSKSGVPLENYNECMGFSRSRA